jgi:hypothetical protein
MDFIPEKWSTHNVSFLAFPALSVVFYYEVSSPLGRPATSGGPRARFGRFFSRPNRYSAHRG